MDGQDETIAIASEKKSALWVRAIFAALSIFIGAIGILNLASLVGHYNYQWHLEISAVIASYHEAVYPLYDMYAVPLLRVLHLNIQITPEIKDAITGLSFAFAAANAESLFRDKKPLIANILGFVVTGFSDENTNKRTMFHKAVNSKIYLAFVLFFVLSIAACAIYFAASWRVSNDSILKDWWGGHWQIFAYIIAGAMLVGMVIGGISTNNGGYYSDNFAINVIGGAIIAVAFVIILPFFLIGIFGAILFFALVLTVIIVLLFFISPIIAWRTVIVTLSLFGMVVLLNSVILMN